MQGSVRTAHTALQWQDFGSLKRDGVRRLFFALQIFSFGGQKSIYKLYNIGYTLRAVL